MYTFTRNTFFFQATREAVLNRTEEYHDARIHSLQNATAVYDLLAIALVKRAQFNKLSDVRIVDLLVK